MQIGFIGICTHIFPLPNQQYRVLLVAADDYAVEDTIANVTIHIPNHFPTLVVSEADIVNSDQIPDFQGSDLMPVPWAVPDLRAWQLSDSVFTIPSLSGGVVMNEVEQCLPHLAVDSNIELLQSVAEGDPPAGLVCATIELTGGSLEVVVDPSGARHTILHWPSNENWDLVVQTPGGNPRPLTLRGEAIIFFNNLGHLHELCSENDYLIHYRVTTVPFVPLPDFHAAEGCTSSRLIDLSNLLPIDSVTLSNCSNSTYP